MPWVARFYNQIDSGVHSTPATLVGNERKSYQYNVLNEALSVTDSDLAPQTGETVNSVNTAAQYDSLGRLTQIVDLERGTHTYSYDADGRHTSAVSGARTLGYSDDLLGRVGCIQDQAPTLSATGACAAPGPIPTCRTPTIRVCWVPRAAPTSRWVGSRRGKATTYFPAPDNTQGYVTEQMQYDKRGRPINASLLISASGGSLSFPTLPTYQQRLVLQRCQSTHHHHDEQQPVGLGVYLHQPSTIATTGVPTGLGNNPSSTANLATQSYNANALLDTLSLQTSTGTALASEQFSYDSNLRPTGRSPPTGKVAVATPGTIYSQALTYDAGEALSPVPP